MLGLAITPRSLDEDSLLKYLILYISYKKEEHNKI